LEELQTGGGVLTLARQGGPEIIVGVEEARLERDRLLVLGNRSVDVPLAPLRNTQVIVNAGRDSLCQRPLAFGEGVPVLALLVQGRAQVVVGIGFIRIERDGLQVLRHRVAQLALVSIRDPEVVVGLGEIGVQLDRLLALGHGVTVTALVIENPRQIAVHLGHVGIKLGRLLVLRQGIVVLAVALQIDAQVVVRRGAVGSAVRTPGNRLPVRDDGIVVAPALVERDARVLGLRQPRIEFERLLVLVHGAGIIAFLTS